MNADAAHLFNIMNTKQDGALNRVPTLFLTKNPGVFQDFPGTP